MKIAYVVSAFVAAVLGFLHYTHMLQLNSYKIHEQIKWYKNNAPYIVLRSGLVMIGLLVFHINAVCAIVINLAVVALQLPKKAKKPLVYTTRIKRLIVSFAVLNAVAFLVCMLLGVYYLFSPVSAAFSFAMVLLCRIINTPVENAVQRYYINDAKRIINSMPGLTVIGVTGSYGKTSTKFYLEKILSQKYNVVVTPESYNTTMGVVRTIREKIKPTHQIFICEMGARGVGQIKEICDIVKPKHGIITSVGAAHLESFKTIENTTKTKFELCDALSDKGTAVLNGDNEYIRNRKIQKNAVYYGLENNGVNSFYAGDICVDSNGTAFTCIDEKGEKKQMRTRLAGKHNIINILGCIAMARVLGLDYTDIMLGVRSINAVPHRLEIKGSESFLILDDAFNSNPAGSTAALEVLQSMEGYKILITPGMVELGALQEESNKNFGILASKVCDCVLLVGRNVAKDIEQGLLEQNYKNYKYFDSFNAAYDYAKTLDSQQQNKVVLIENDLPDNY